MLTIPTLYNYILTISGPTTGGRAALSEVLVGLSGDMSSISGRFTDTGMLGIRPPAELLLSGAFWRLPELELPRSGGCF